MLDFMIFYLTYTYQKLQFKYFKIILKKIVIQIFIEGRNLMKIHNELDLKVKVE